MHAELGLTKSMIANVRAAIGYVRAAAEPAVIAANGDAIRNSRCAVLSRSRGLPRCASKVRGRLRQWRRIWPVQTGLF